MRTSRFSRLLGLIVGVGGFAAASALAPAGSALELPPAPTVTVVVPTLPAPPPVPPAPTPPPPPPVQPLPPAPPPPPVVAAPPPPPVVAAPPRSSPAPAAPSVSAPPSSSPQPASAASPGSAESPARSSKATKQSGQLEATPHRARNRVSVRLEFVLPEAGRVFLIVRGPAPSCRVAGVIPVRGRQGANTVSFTGRVRGRILEPGVYVLTLSPNRQPAADAQAASVRVVSPRRAVPLPDAERKQSCSEAEAVAAAPSGGILLGERRPAAGTPAARPSAPLRPPLQHSATAERGDDGLAGFLADPGSLGAAAGDGNLEALATIAALTVIGALLLTMLALVTRFVRGSWNP